MGLSGAEGKTQLVRLAYHKPCETLMTPCIFSAPTSAALFICVFERQRGSSDEISLLRGKGRLDTNSNIPFVGL